MYKNLSYNDTKRGLIIPKNLNKELAEETGIHVGDGSLGIYKHNTGIKYAYSISGGHNDKFYFEEFVIPLMHKIYNLSPIIYKPKNQKSLELHYQSKGLVYFKKSLGLPLGKKRDITIPKRILISDFKLDFIRGLFDTDGCLRFQKRYRNVNYYPSIDITSQSSKLIMQVSKILERKKFTNSLILDTPRKRKETLCKESRIYIYGKENLFKWMEIIGTSNPKNRIKFSLWKKYGYVPKRI